MVLKEVGELGYKALQQIADNAIVADSLICTRSSCVFLSQLYNSNGPAILAYAILTGISLASAWLSYDLEMKIWKH